MRAKRVEAMSVRCGDERLFEFSRDGEGGLSPEAFAELVHAKVLIHGHEPCATGYQVPNDLQVIIDGAGPTACYLLLPLDRPLTHGDVVKQVRRLHG